MKTRTIKKPTIPGPGLKKEGVVFLQSLFIFIFVSLEMWIRSGTGVISGLIIALVTYGGVTYGRSGTRYVAAVTPPIAFASTALFMTILSDGLRPTRVGVDFVASLASVAPFLLVSALYAWFMFLNEKAKSRPSKRAVES
ncbi:MAG: hypothetical protein F2851_02870 [Actinobacteria bacterium]|uniref:Unannotated protein n=1 Tax=freshwater metagenome TaxID=449393 RepID=A0A6J5Z4D2_9ZZZZ|nr:hypothetical protein [Actinomycetota bacterium]